MKKSKATEALRVATDVAAIRAALHQHCVLNQQKNAIAYLRNFQRVNLEKLKQAPYHSFYGILNRRLGMNQSGIK